MLIKSKNYSSKRPSGKGCSVFRGAKMPVFTRIFSEFILILAKYDVNQAVLEAYSVIKRRNHKGSGRFR